MRSLLTFTALLFLAVPATTAQSRYSENPGSLLGFGGAIAISDGNVYIGSAPTSWPTGSDPAGEIYRYTKNGQGEWVETGRVSASDGTHGNEFGRSIFIQDGKMIVGAPGVESVYVFQNTNGTWTEIQKLDSSGKLKQGHEIGGAYERGGYRTQTIALAGNGLYLTTYNADTSEGSVRTIHQMGTDWHDMGTISEAAAWSIAIEGNLLFVGTPEANESNGGVLIYDLSDDHNPALVYEINQGNLGELNLSSDALFGRSLAVDGNTLYVGAVGQEQFGAVFVFIKSDAGEWSLESTIRQSEPEEGQNNIDQFGGELVLSGSDLLVGARGAAFIFNTKDLAGAYTKLDAPENQKGRGFGVGLAIEGDVLAVGAPNADFESGRATIYERNARGEWMLAGTAENDVVRFESISGDQIDCEDGLVNDLFPCDNVDLLSMISTGDLVHDRGANLNDIWGWEDPQTGKEYVLAGRTDGTSFIDISDPGHPVIVGQLMRTEGSPGSWWRDIKVYKDHAFIVADGAGNHGMQIFDLGQLRDVDPAAMPVDFEVSALYTGVASSHNIIINEDTGFAYAIGSRAGGEGCGGQLHMMDIHDPLNPKFLGCYTHPDYGGTHDAQCVVYHGDDTDYNGREICLNSNGSALIVADVTDKTNPTTVAVATYPKTAYTHQGWLSEDHNYFYMNDELDEMNKIVDKTRTLIWDMRDLDEPILVKEYYHGVGASDHNLYINGNFMYQSNYQAGLRILDISDPENPVEVAYFDTAPYADDTFGFAGSWSNYPYFKSGVIAISSQGEGIFLVRKREVDL